MKRRISPFFEPRYRRYSNLSAAAALGKLMHVHRPFSNRLNGPFCFSSPFALSVKGQYLRNLSTLFISYWAAPPLSNHGTNSSCHGSPDGCQRLPGSPWQLSGWPPLRIPNLAAIDTTTMTISRALVHRWPILKVPCLRLRP